MPASKREHGPSKALWQEHMEHIKKYYITDCRPLNDVVDLMKSNHNFDAKPSAYKSHFKQWGFRKNNREVDIQARIRELNKRDAQGEQTVIQPYGREIDRAEIKRYLNRKGIKSMEDALQSGGLVDRGTPAGLILLTPLLAANEGVPTRENFQTLTPSRLNHTDLPGDVVPLRINNDSLHPMSLSDSQPSYLLLPQMNHTARPPTRVSSFVSSWPQEGDSLDPRHEHSLAPDSVIAPVDLMYNQPAETTLHQCWQRYCHRHVVQECASELCQSDTYSWWVPGYRFPYTEQFANSPTQAPHDWNLDANTTRL